MPKSTGKVLVLDADMTPALAVVRSLGQLGLQIDSASFVLPAIARYSRYSQRHFLHPDPLREPQAFCDWLTTHIESQGYDWVFPVTERSVTAVLPLLDEPRWAQHLALPPRAALETALDKEATLALAAELAIPAPLSWTLKHSDDLAQLPDDITYPLVVKPAKSIGDNGEQRQQLSVSYAHNAEELAAKVAHALLFGDVLIQQYIAGDGVGIELIAKHGDIQLAFQHKRLHEVPLTGGGSSWRESVAPHHTLLQAAGKLMKALNWHGVAMVEFKHNPADGSYALMEINGRFWGSLPLAIAAGANFPALLYHLHQHGDCGPLPRVRTGVTCRKLSADLIWAELVLRRQGDPSMVNFPSRGQLLRDTLKIFSPKHHFDVQQWRDPWPGLVDLGGILRDQFQRVQNLIIEAKQTHQQRRLWQKWLNSGQLARSRQLLFLCYGNINRSALAQRLFEQQHADLKALARPLEVESAGFHAHTGRPADPVMRQVAAEQGIDMENSSSRCVDGDMVAQADVILVMEHAHRNRLLESFPQAADKTLLLGMLPGNDGPNEIADPYGQARSGYRQAFARLQHSCQLLADHLRGQ